MAVTFKRFKSAVQGFEYLVTVDLKTLADVLDERLIDGIENGTVQKFEYTTELCWKLLKRFLKLEDGVDAKTPKKSVKEFYRAGYVNEDHYLKLIDMIDDRNLLSHVYSNEEFKKIIKKFPTYVDTLNHIIDIIERSTSVLKDEDAA